MSAYEMQRWRGRCGDGEKLVYSTGANRVLEKFYEDYLGCFLDDPLQNCLSQSMFLVCSR